MNTHKNPFELNPLNMGLWESLFRRHKAKSHSLKWPLPESRLTIPLDDAARTVAALKKNKAKFVSGGEYRDLVHAKDYGSAFAYFILRTDARTDEEELLFDGYMIQEEERLGTSLSSGGIISNDLEALGYARVLSRSLTEWRFNAGLLRAAVFEIDGFGALLEIALPESKTVQGRELQEKAAKSLLKKLELNEADAVPTDAITLQLTAMMQQKEVSDLKPREVKNRREIS